MRSDREEPDKMPHYASFRQGLHYSTLFSKKKIFREMKFLELIPCGPSIYTMDHPKVILTQKEESKSL